MDPKLKKYLTQQFKNVATKDDLKKFATKNDILGLKNDFSGLKQDIVGLRAHIDKSVGEVRSDIADLGQTINETVAMPLERLIDMTKDYPLIHGDVKRIKRNLQAF